MCLTRTDPSAESRRRLIVAILFVVATLAALAMPGLAEAQITPCSVNEPQPGTPDYHLPPAGSPPLVRCIQPLFHPLNESLLDVETTYLYYIKTRGSLMSRQQWQPYKEDALLADFNAVWRTGFLDDMWIEVVDEPYENGVVGKHIIYHMEERSRLKAIDYEGSKKVEISKIEEALKAKGITLRFDTFIDQSTIRRVQGIIRELYAEQGYQAAEVTPELTTLEGGPKLARLTFHIDQGPEVKIREIVFDGNSAYSDKKLIGKMKENKPRNWLSFITDSGTYQEAKFADDATNITDFYQNNGYVQARVGTPQIETIEDSKDRKTRWIRLRIPVDEGTRYRLGKFDIVGNTALKADALRKLFKLKEGDVVSRKSLIKGIEEAHKLYGMFGYFNFNAYPDFCFRGTDCTTGKPLAEGALPPIADITMHFDEGKPFFVNRITFTGNTTTHDAVIRREMRVAEGGIFNSEALKDSVKRLNQLGYFKPLEKAEDFQVVPTPGAENLVDVKLRFEEQNRNQLAFGAGVSQFDGFFGQLSFQTSNFLGRGETLGISLQKGSQAKNYQVSFTEPYLFDRPISTGIDMYSRQFIFPGSYTEDETGGNTVVSVPLGGFKRASLGYGYTRIRIHDIAPIYQGIFQDVSYAISRISPGFLYNTVDQPIFPTSGKRLSVGFGIAGLGGDTEFVSSSVESVWYHRLSNRMSFGIRGQAQYSRPYGDTTALPLSEQVYLGGEYSIRGFDIRSIGPRDPASGLVIGGNKSLLFNAEYYINVVGPVRFLFFYDAGQARQIGQRFAWKDNIVEVVQPPPPLLSDPLAFTVLLPPDAPQPTTRVIGETSAFKTSTGVELRFFMPVLNVPFRLIGAYNPQRFGVLNNNGRLTPKFTFRFAVGTTF
jgi:outer membrane protein insertion porin family